MTEWNKPQHIIPMKKWIEKPFVMLLVKHRKKPSNTEFYRKNCHEIEVVLKKVPMQIRIVPMMELRQYLPQCVIEKLNGKIELYKNVEQVDDHQIDHQKVNDEKRCAALVLKIRPVDFEHVTKLTALRIFTLRPTNTVYHV